jgi:tripartite-type tricarboxylate transporter receptor subunit TctC
LLKRSIRQLALPAIALTTALLAVPTATAQEIFPDRAVRVVVPYAAGGATDPPARLVADRLSKQLGQPFVVENRPGAGGRIGTDGVIHSAPNGYTILAAPSGIVINALLYPKGAYDVDKELTPIGLINRIPMVVVASPKAGIRTLSELIKVARDKPGTVNYGITGIGTLDHLAYDHLRTVEKLDMTRIDYQGVPQALTGLLAGDIPTMVIALSAALPQIRAGKIVPLAITSASRAPTLPDVPTMAEAGVPNFVMYGWSMMFVPSGVPAPIAQKLHDEMAKTLAQPEVRKTLTDIGGEVIDMSLPELKDFVRQNNTFFGEVVRASNIHIQ